MKHALTITAILLLLVSILLVVTGAANTQSRATNHPETAMVTPAHHKLLGELAGVLALLLALAVTFAKPAAPALLPALVWIPVVTVIASAIAGASSPASSRWAGFWHSLLAQLFVASAATVTAAIATPPVAVPITDKGWPSLRGYATLTLFLVIVQVCLGAAFRHELMGVMWHIIGALLLALFILGLAMLVLNLPAESVPQGNPLKTPAILLIVFAGLQLTLGMTVISVKANSPALAPVTIAHAATAALTLASTAVLTLLARHHARRIAS